MATIKNKKFLAEAIKKNIEDNRIFAKWLQQIEILGNNLKNDLDSERTVVARSDLAHLERIEKEYKGLDIEGLSKHIKDMSHGELMVIKSKTWKEETEDYIRLQGYWQRDKKELAELKQQLEESQKTAKEMTEKCVSLGERNLELSRQLEVVDQKETIEIPTWMNKIQKF
jgi:hypothetical protein